MYVWYDTKRYQPYESDHFNTERMNMNLSHDAVLQV